MSKITRRRVLAGVVALAATAGLAACGSKKAEETTTTAAATETTAAATETTAAATETTAAATETTAAGTAAPTTLNEMLGIKNDPVSYTHLTLPTIYSV